MANYYSAIDNVLSGTPIKLFFSNDSVGSIECDSVYNTEFYEIMPGNNYSLYLLPR